jgi:anaerobic selenocysteine-containing dehydrogenase
MSLSRRGFLTLLSAAGVSISANEWLLSRLETYAEDRLDFRDVRGPGIVSLSRSVCRDCANHCSLTVRKVDELPVGIRGTPWHPASRGGLCVAGQSQMQALFDPDRLARPILRDDAGAPGRTVEWEEGLDVLVKRVAQLVSSGKGERLAVVDGRTPSLGTRLLESWVRSIPGARYIPLRIERALDRLARDFLGGAPGGRLSFDLAGTGTLLLAGSEILEVDGSPVTQMREHGERRENPRLDHAPTIYLGPRQSPTAIHGDYWVPCQPGWEREILLSLAEALGKEHAHRESIQREYAHWIPEARDRVEFARSYSLENVARRRGLKLDELETVVRALREFGPAVTLPGPSLLRRPHGSSAARAALALNLWTGGFGGQGGLSWQADPLSDVAERMGLAPAIDPDPGSLEGILRPLFEIKRSPVDVLLCVDANLAHEFPGRDQMARALGHVPFLACLSCHEDETTRLAHVTLPTLLCAESWDLPAPAWGLPEGCVAVQRPALVPVVEARAVEDIVLELASAGVAGSGFSPPAKDARGLVEAAVGVIVARGRGELVQSDRRRPLSPSTARSTTGLLRKSEAFWVDSSRRGPKARGPAPRVAATPSPLGDLSPDQLWLVPFDAPAIQRGRVLNRPMLMEIAGLMHGIAWESWVEIHPADARPRDISNGNRVKIRGPRAEIAVRAVVTRTVMRGSVAAPVGFGHEALGSVAAGRGSNTLALPFAVLDLETGAPAWGPIPVFLVKA